MHRVSLLWKLVLAPLVAVVCFGLYVLYMASVLGDSNQSFESIRDTQFPTVAAITENTAWLDKLVDAFKSAASTGEIEPLDTAKKIAEKVRNHYSNLASIDKLHAGDFNKLLEEFDSYFTVTYSISEKMASGSELPDASEFGKMTTALDLYRNHLTEFRALVDERFSNTVDSSTKKAKNARQVGFIVGVVIIVIALALGAMFARQIMRELGGEPHYVASVMGKIAAGELKINFSDKIEPDSLLEAVQKTVLSLQGIVLTIRDLAEQVNTKALQLSSSAQSMADGAGLGSNAIASMSTSLDEMSSSAQHIASNAEIAEKNSSHSLELSTEGEKLTSLVREEVGRISSSIDAVSSRISSLVTHSTEVGAIAEVISDIASQTNLLALNAAIEAARAGEHGRGFAVVADEVRSLAERTAKATVEIVSMVDSIHAETQHAVTAMDAVKPQVDKGVELMGETSEALTSIRSGASDTLSKVQDVVSATNKQSASAQSISGEMSQIIELVSQTEQSVAQTASVCDELVHIGSDLKKLLDQFQV